MEWIAEVLAAKDRNLAGPTAKAGGLYLVDVDYPAEFPGCPGRPSAPCGCRTRHRVRPVLVTGPENLWFNDPSFIAIEPLSH